jgi:hypothetical protein
MTITSRGDNGVLFEGTKGRIFVNRGKITGKPIEENWDKDQYTKKPTMSSSFTKASRPKVTRTTSIAAFAKVVCLCPTSSAMCRR